MLTLMIGTITDEERKREELERRNQEKRSQMFNQSTVSGQ